MNKERLLTLAAHLRNSEARIHPDFDFNLVNSFDKKTRKEVPYCGSAGCAIGETPALWPDEVSFSTSGIYNLYYRGKDMPYDKVAELLFDISVEEAVALFSPGCKLPWWLLGNHGAMQVLHGDAKPEEVAESIERFVKWKEEQQ